MKNFIKEDNFVEEQKMSMDELSTDVQNLLYKYCSGTPINDLTVNNFHKIKRYIVYIMKNPEEVLEEIT